MKKLLTMLAAVAVATVAQAGYVSWTISGVQDKNGDGLTAGAVYMFFVDQGSSTAKADTSWVADLAGKGADAITTALSGSQYQYTKADVPNGAGATAGTFSYNASTMASGRSVPSNSDLGLVGASTSHKYSVYAVIFDTDTVTDASNFMVTTATTGQTVMGDSAGTTKSYTIGSQAGATWYAVKSGTSDVPEPTSGLLLLVGGAMLALRRRRS